MWDGPLHLSCTHVECACMSVARACAHLAPLFPGNLAVPVDVKAVEEVLLLGGVERRALEKVAELREQRGREGNGVRKDSERQQAAKGMGGGGDRRLSPTYANTHAPRTW